MQSVTERLPAALAPHDRALLEALGRPEPCPDVPGAVIVPGSGPHEVDYSLAGSLLYLKTPPPARARHCDMRHELLTLLSAT